MISPQTLFNSNSKVVVEKEINIKDLLDKYFLHYWYLYVLFSVLGIGLAYGYLTYYSTPIYQIKSRLLIKEDKSQSFAPGDKLLKDLNLFGASENVSNEIQIISSFSLMEQVVNDLNLDTRFNYKHWIKSIPVYQNFPIILDTFSLSTSALHSAEYRDGSGISFQILPLDYQQFDLIKGEEIIGTYNFEELFVNEFGAFKFLIRPPLNLNSDSTMHITFQDPEMVAKNYWTNLQVDLVDMEATILQLKLTESTPQKGLDILNRLIEIYNSQTIDDKEIITRNSLKFINERLEGLTQELSAVESNVEQYKKQNQISSESTGGLDIVMREMSKFTEEQSNLEVQLSILESMSTFLDSSAEFDLIPASLSGANPALTNTVQAYNQLVLNRQKLLETAQPSNPMVVSGEQQLKRLESVLRVTINNIKRDFRKKLNSVASLNDDLSVRLKKAPTQERGLLEIKRQQAVKENLYLFLLQKKEETALSLIATTGNSKVIDQPRSQRKAIAPRRSLVYLGGLFGGFLFPFLLIVGKDVFQTTIQTEEDIKSITNASIIGTINQTKKKNIIAVLKNSRTAIAERFRLIRTNLQFHNKKQAQQTILITSSVSGEGKTFVAINLALSFSLTKQKTILLGMDLRKPKMKEYLGTVEESPGISEYLKGKCSLNEIIHIYEESSNLQYISCGKIPFNPHELLLEESVQKLFTQLKKIYDVIIIDTPPVGLVSDAILLNEYVTDSIYVVRANTTQKQMLENANQLFIQKKLKNTFVLFNGVNMNSGYGYKRYGYGGKYGYYEN